MSDERPENKGQGKLSFDIDFKDIVQMVSQAGNKNFIGSDTKEAAESEAIKKAWFEHMLLSIEKLQDAIEDVRRVEIYNLKKDVEKHLEKLEKNLEKFEAALKLEIAKVEVSLKDHEKEYKDDKKTVIDPMRTNITRLSVKMGFYGAIGGVLSSALVTLILYAINEWFIKVTP
jgi:phenylalanyl-tRNA synthetase alpha subunit